MPEVYFALPVCNGNSLVSTLVGEGGIDKSNNNCGDARKFTKTTRGIQGIKTRSARDWHVSRFQHRRHRSLAVGMSEAGLEYTVDL
eukprot:1059154-Amorphochlora_amoeboformis.AAC.2